MATDLCLRDRAVVPFEPRRTPQARVVRDHGGAKVLHFSARAGADAGRRSRQEFQGTGREIGEDSRYGLIGLFESAMQTNIRTVHAIFGLGDAATWIELQQRAVRDYMAATTAIHLGLVRAMSNAVAGSAAGSRPLETPPLV